MNNGILGGLLGGLVPGGLASGNKQGMASALLGMGPGAMFGGGSMPMMGALGLMPGMMGQKMAGGDGAWDKRPIGAPGFPPNLTMDDLIRMLQTLPQFPPTQGRG
jgi:hypothetical protein